MHLAEASVRNSPRTASDRFEIAISGKKSFIFENINFCLLVNEGMWMPCYFFLVPEVY